MHALGADLRDDATFGFLDEHGVEPVRAADQKGPRAHGMTNSCRNLVAVAHSAGETRPRASHVLQRQRERYDSASVYGLADLLLGQRRPLGDGLQTTPLHGV